MFTAPSITLVSSLNRFLWLAGWAKSHKMPQKSAAFPSKIRKNNSVLYNSVTAWVQENCSHGKGVGVVHTTQQHTQQHRSQLEVNSIPAFSILRLLSGSGLQCDIVRER